MTDTLIDKPFEDNPTTRAAEAIWKHLDPQDEIGKGLGMPHRFFEAAQVALRAAFPTREREIWLEVRDCDGRYHRFDVTNQYPEGTSPLPFHVGRPSEIPVIKQAYLALLQLPPDDTFRILNQDIYVRLRANVAYEEGRSDEDAQNECEAGILTWVDTRESPRNKPCHICGKMVHEEGAGYCSGGHIRPKRESVKREPCHADRDGECDWFACPQLKDGEPKTSGRHCPLDNDIEGGHS